MIPQKDECLIEKREVCWKKIVLPFYQKIKDLLRRRKGSVGGQEDVDVGGLELAGVRSRQTLDQLFQGTRFDESNPHRFPL